MKKIRITALRKTIYTDLIEIYENPITHACPIEEGQQWISKEALCPQGFCESAWQNLYPYVFALAHGANDFFDGWMKNPNTALISCNDGFRPVSFLLETMEENE